MLQRRMLELSCPAGSGRHGSCFIALSRCCTKDSHCSHSAFHLPSPGERPLFGYRRNQCSQRTQEENKPALLEVMALRGGLHLHPPFPLSCMRFGLLMSKSDNCCWPACLLRQQLLVTCVAQGNVAGEVSTTPQLNPDEQRGQRRAWDMFHKPLNKQDVHMRQEHISDSTHNPGRTVAVLMALKKTGKKLLSCWPRLRPTAGWLCQTAP